jgi:hypothetical protein
VDAFAPLNTCQLTELAREAWRIGHVLESEAELDLGPVEVRAHL